VWRRSLIPPNELCAAAAAETTSTTMYARDGVDPKIKDRSLGKNGARAKNPNWPRCEREHIIIALERKRLRGFLQAVRSGVGTGKIIKSIISRIPDIDVDCSFLQESCNLESNKLILKLIIFDYLI
jgi:hypothetical protein